jgi:hypothetical protein
MLVGVGKDAVASLKNPTMTITLTITVTALLAVHTRAQLHSQQLMALMTLFDETGSSFCVVNLFLFGVVL